MNDDQSMKDLFDLIENDLYACEFADQDFSQIEKFKFDNNNKFIIGYGQTRILIYPIDTSKPMQTVKIDENQFGKILDLSFSSNSDDSYHCFVACNIDKLKKISIFDICLESPQIINFFYEYEITE